MISENTGLAGSGGIENYDGIVTLTNSTVSGNTACDSGGGIFMQPAGMLVAYNVTITGNHANSAVILSICPNFGGNTSGTGGGIKRTGGVVNMRNTIIALNVHVDKNGFAVDDDCSGMLGTLSYSLLTTEEGCTITNDNTITGQNPKLGPLADNGGPTLTHALKEDSPAIDAGNLSGCKDADGKLLTTDQRGQPRPNDGDLNGTKICAMGAYELNNNSSFYYLPFLGK